MSYTGAMECEVMESNGTEARVHIVSVPIQLGGLMVTQPFSVPINESLKHDAEWWGITIEEAYQQELEYQQTAAKEALSPDELHKLVETSQPSKRLLEGDEECPF